MTPRSRKSGNGLLLGCRSALDRGSDKKTYFGDAQKEMGKNGGNLHRLFGYLISIDRGWSNQWVASLVVRESRERRGKIFAGKTEKRNFGLKFSIFRAGSHVVRETRDRRNIFL